MRSAASKRAAAATKSKDDRNDLRATITDIRDKIKNLEMKVIDFYLSAVHRLTLISR